MDGCRRQRRESIYSGSSGRPHREQSALEYAYKSYGSFTSHAAGGLELSNKIRLPQPDCAGGIFFLSQSSTSIDKNIITPMDPFSAATGAAGLISLGLTVSNGLIQYCRDYRSQDDDLSQLAQHARDLQSILTLIENRTTQLQSPDGDINTSFQGCRDACDACLQDFKRLNDKYAGSKRGHTSKGHDWKLLQNLKYPFDKRKFEDVRSRLQEFNARVLGYLQLANLDLTRDMRTQMTSESTRVATAIEAAGRQLQSSIHSTEHAVNSTIRHGIDRLEVSFEQGLQKAETNLATTVAVSLRGLSDNLGERQGQQTSTIMHRLDQVVQMLQNQNVTQTTNPATENRMVLGLPSMDDSYKYGSVVRTPSSGVPTKSIFCNCPRTRYRHSTMQHRQDCPCSVSNRKKRNFTLKLGVFRHQIIATWNIEYSPLAWVRDCRIYPNLTLRATVDDDAPAFQAIRRVGDVFSRWSPTVQEIEETLQNCLVDLQQTFTTGRGWPTDVDELGESLLHHVLNIARFRLCNENIATLLIQFIYALVQMGVAMNDIGIEGTPLQVLVSTLRRNYPITVGTYMVVNKLIDMDASIDPETATPLEPVLLLDIPDLYEHFACTEFLHHILHRSESDVIRLLRRDPSLLYDRTQDGQTPLHLVAKWPKGLSILIDFAGEAIHSIINITDQSGYTSFEYAVMLGEPMSVRLLLNAGASIETDVFNHLGYGESTARRETIICTIVESIILQRRALSDLAWRRLPSEVIDKLALDDDLLDHKAFDVAKALRQHRVPVPVIYDTLRPGSVYNWRGVNVGIAQKLFDVGFHQIDTDVGGYTPFMTLECFSPMSFADYLELLCWFEDRGSDLHATLPVVAHHTATSNAEGMVPVYPAIHKISYDLGTNPPFREIPTQLLSRFSKLLRDEYKDPCLCYCTTKGCTSASKYGLGVSEYFSDVFVKISKSVRFVGEAISSCDGHRAALAFLRVTTFEMLGMKHTCCSYKWRWGLVDILEDGLLCLMDPEEVEEIREEDRHLARLLDTLMEEFEAKLQEMNLPLSEFVEKYWLPRMQEVEKERDELSARDLHAIREIGVVLDGS
ncbi:hypothetical protein F5Y06DRAFT_278556 [Hypoxylon sp. FL0890]|nr:hypothetical protein F5Y06DRAFT_278556 [Hypoxylon sp. FL0890]